MVSSRPGSYAEAEDAVQQALVRAWQNAERFEGRSSLRSCAYRIATNVRLDVPPGPPRSARRSPVALATWFSQDIVDEFPDHHAVVADYAATTHPQLIARLVGELHELLALPLDEGDYALAAAELGMEVGPPEPFSHGAWLQSVATTLSDV